MAKMKDTEKDMLKAKRDALKEAAAAMDLTAKTIKQFPITDGEIKDLIKLFYQFQDERIAVSNEAYAEIKNGYTEGVETNPVLLLRIQKTLEDMEEDIGKFLKHYVKHNPVGTWMMSHLGIGPVYAAGLLAYIDIDRCQTAGSIWRYAGITGNPNLDKRKKGQKIHYDPDLKVLCWKMGENFKKVCNNEKAVYGQLYKEKLEYYKRKNEEGGFADRAKEILQEKSYDKSTAAYKAYSQGKLPDGHMISMAKRFAVKMFLSHLFDVWFEYRHGLKPPAPFVKEHLGHVHIIAPPNRELLIPDTKGDAHPYTIITNRMEERVVRTELKDFDEIIIRCHRYIEHISDPNKPATIIKIVDDRDNVIYEDKTVPIIDESEVVAVSDSSNDKTDSGTKRAKVTYMVTFVDGTTDQFKTSSANYQQFARNKYKDKKDNIVKVEPVD